MFVDVQKSCFSGVMFADMHARVYGAPEGTCNRLTSFDETSAYGARPVLVSRASRSAREIW